MGLALRAAVGRLVVWLSNDVLACPGLAVMWLIRGAKRPGPESGMPATVLLFP